MSSHKALWQAVLDTDGSASVIHKHAAAHTVAERQALPFPWSRAVVKTLAFTTSDIPLLLVAPRANDRVDAVRLTRALVTSRPQLRAAGTDLLGEEAWPPEASRRSATAPTCRG
ncbi:hypothetical protein [Streptomyces sp. NPDC090445]|uniref:hypothetical protein n=1 Tax=Streptomyces sp. NPDC090445 TaxID=3365963 RepID=UPI0037FA78BB